MRLHKGPPLDTPQLAAGFFTCVLAFRHWGQVRDQGDPREGVVEDPPGGSPAPNRGRLHLVEDDECQILRIVLGEEPGEQGRVLPQVANRN